MHCNILQDLLPCNILLSNFRNSTNLSYNITDSIFVCRITRALFNDRLIFFGPTLAIIHCCSLAIGRGRPLIKIAYMTFATVRPPGLFARDQFGLRSCLQPALDVQPAKRNRYAQTPDSWLTEYVRSDGVRIYRC